MKCYVCGNGPHPQTPLHAYWPEDEAQAEFAAQPQGVEPSMTAAETLNPLEAVYA